MTSLRVIHALTNAEASHGLPVAFEATVTYYRGYETNLFVQDGEFAIYIQAPANLHLVPGDRILVQGKTQGSFNPIVIAERITLLRHAALPKAEPVSFDQMIRAETDCKLVTVRGVVRAADLLLSLEAPVHYIRLQLLMDGGYFDANVDSDDAGALQRLLDADVELTGVASEEFDGKMHETGVLLHIQSLSGVKIMARANSTPWALPVTSMDQIIAVSHLRDFTPRVRVHGTITYYQPGSAVVLQDGDKSIWISTLTQIPLRIGDVADATGFPDVHDGFVNLVHGELRDTLTSAPVTPLPSTWRTLTPKGYDSPGHHLDLVSIEGQVVTEVREPSQDEFVLAVEGKQFSAILRHPNGPLAATREIPLGSRVRVTGICALELSSPFIAQVPFNILLRSYDDISVVARPSLVNTRNLLLILGLLLVVVFAALTRGWALEHKVRQQTAVMSSRTEAEAELERRRSRILEDINGTRPLTEILDEITELISSTLGGAHCWCEVSEGAQSIESPPPDNTLRLIHEEIPSRSGPSLGKLFVAFSPDTAPRPLENESLLMGTRLATLAIETRRLYSDLRQRSEFDQLTEIHNRFSLEQNLEALIGKARQNASIFGLIYIDLDQFKQINDLYGHHTGDLLLHEVARRMKEQLLGHDMLARLGGDEFAALVSVVRDRSEVEVIAKRLNSCFDNPIVIEDHRLQGSASIGFALYPEDGNTKDSLLSVADAAMYAFKKRKHQAELNAA